MRLRLKGTRSLYRSASAQASISRALIANAFRAVGGFDGFIGSFGIFYHGNIGADAPTNTSAKTAATMVLVF